MATLVRDGGKFRVDYTNSWTMPPDPGKIIFVEKEYRPNYIFCKVDKRIFKKTISDAEVWCQQSQCGRYVSLYHFSFKNEEELTMFTLRWS
jgi:hypothetical protein